MNPRVSVAGVELGRLLDLCLDGLPRRTPLTLVPDASHPLIDSLHAWRDTVFQPAIAPSLRQALGHAALDQPIELERIDRELDRLLCEPARSNSERLGRLLLRRMPCPKSLRAPAKISQRALAGEIPGHHAIVFAMLCGIFHIPLLQALQGYVHIELLAAADLHRSPPEQLAAALEQIPALTRPHLLLPPDQ